MLGNQLYMVIYNKCIADLTDYASFSAYLLGTEYFEPLYEIRQSLPILRNSILSMIYSRVRGFRFSFFRSLNGTLFVVPCTLQ
jgi:hypothetical protein